MSNLESVDPDYEKADRLEAEGVGLFSRKEHTRALEAFTEAAHIFGRLQSTQTNEYLKYRFASAVNNTGCAHLELGTMEPAQEAFVQAADLFGQLWDRNSTRSDFGNDFAAALNNLGHVLSFTDKPETAEKFFAESLRIREEVRSRFPKDRKAVEGLWNTSELLGNLYEKLGNVSKTAAMRSRAKRFREAPGPWFAGAGQNVNQFRGLSGAKSVTPEERATHMREKLALADYLMTQRLYAEAIETYSELVYRFRSGEDAQALERLDANKAISPQIRWIDAKKELAMLLHRLANAYEAIGDHAREMKHLRELVECLAEAAMRADGNVRTSLEEQLRKAMAVLFFKGGRSSRDE